MARRKFTTFSLSFLDVMSCGLGAVVLIFFILNHDSTQAFEQDNEVLLAEMRRLDFLSEESGMSLEDLRSSIQQIEQQLDQTRDSKTELEREVETDEQSLEEIQLTLSDEQSRIEDLMRQVERQEQQLEDLEVLAEDSGGTSLRELEGEGSRQYLSGMRMDGRNIVVAIDTSASMLDETLVNAIRKRNLPPERRRE